MCRLQAAPTWLPCGNWLCKTRSAVRCVPVDMLPAASTPQGPEHESTNRHLISASAVPDSPVAGTASPGRVDLTAHTGLRGLLAVYVVVFHLCMFGPLQWDLQGSAIMPFFFLLSGFSLAVVYTDPDALAAEAARSARQRATSPPRLAPLDWQTFMQNRWARVGPLYVLGNVAGFALTFTGHGSTPPQPDTLGPASAVTASFTSTLFGGAFGLPLDPPTWTIATLLVLWAVFPLALRWSQRLTRAELARNIVLLYWLQVLTMLCFIVFSVLTGLGQPFINGTMNPLSRVPLFLMGVLGGILHLHNAGAEAHIWPTLPLCCTRCTASDANSCCGDCAGNVDAWAAGLVTAFVAFIIPNVGWGLQTGGAVYLQAFAPMAQLALISALARGGQGRGEGQGPRGRCRCKSLLSSAPAQWLGKLSLAIYVVHFPIMNTFTWAVAGQLPVDVELRCESAFQPGTLARKRCEDARAEYFAARALPVWAILPAFVASLVLAWTVYQLVEAPCRARLRAEATQRSLPEQAELFNVLPTVMEESQEESDGVTSASESPHLGSTAAAGALVELPALPASRGP